MQIILVQAEVEQAIKDYIANRVTLAEGTEIAIDLKAGRGPEGFTASIDIVPIVAQPQTATNPVKRAVAPKAVEAAQATDESETDVQEVSSPQETTSSESTDGADVENSTAETASDDTDETTPTPARSLFAGLKKPVNG